MYKNEIEIEVRKNNFNGLYAIKIKGYYNDKYSGEYKWMEIKKFLTNRNIDCPKVKDIKFFSDGFGYSYGWFDGYGFPIGNVAA